MSESKEIATMRAMVWERAKAELNGYLHTFWPEHTKDDTDFKEANNRITSFIKDFEDNCL